MDFVFMASTPKVQRRNGATVFTSRTGLETPRGQLHRYVQIVEGAIGHKTRNRKAKGS